MRLLLPWWRCHTWSTLIKELLLVQGLKMILGANQQACRPLRYKETNTQMSLWVDFHLRLHPQECQHLVTGALQVCAMRTCYAVARFMPELQKLRSCRSALSYHCYHWLVIAYCAAMAHQYRAWIHSILALPWAPQAHVFSSDVGNRGKACISCFLIFYVDLDTFVEWTFPPSPCPLLLSDLCALPRELGAQFSLYNHLWQVNLLLYPSFADGHNPVSCLSVRI